MATGGPQWLATLRVRVANDRVEDTLRLAAGAVGLALFVLDLLPFKLPNGYSSGVLLFFASGFLIASWAIAPARREERNQRLSSDAQVERLVGSVEGLLSTANVRELPSAQIEQTLNELLAGSSSWRFRGGSGR